MSREAKPINKRVQKHKSGGLLKITADPVFWLRLPNLNLAVLLLVHA
jgi:hypothetical protein